MGPLLYVLYTAELSAVIAQHGLCFHQYADDSQIYVSTMVNEAPLAVQRFTECVRAINDWMSASRLKLNPTKTEVLWLGSCQQLSQISISVIPLQSTTIRVVESARDLGVVIDSKLSLSAHVAALCHKNGISGSLTFHESKLHVINLNLLVSITCVNSVQY